MATVSAAPSGTRLSPKKTHWTARFLNSTIGGKYIVALTGLALTGFVVVHLLGNLQIFLGRDAFNKYAHSLKSMGPLLWIARGGLLALFLTHIALTLRLKKRSLDARPVGYAYERTKKASVPSRYMVLTGLLLLLFVAFHLAHFTLGWVDRVEVKSLGERINYLDLKDPTWKDPSDPTHTRHDAYHMFIDGFRNVPIALLYIAMMLVLGAHLSHGIRSAFQSLGVNSAKINDGLTMAALGLTALIVGGNILMPIAVMTGLIGGDIPR